MNTKNAGKRVHLAKGEMKVYPFGNIRLHAYKTNDPIDNEVFIVEKEGQAVLIESPCFYENNRELEAYLREQNLAVAGILLSYHMAGGSFLPEAKRYATANADDYGHRGGGKALIDNFASAFGSAFDSSVHTINETLLEGPVAIGGIRFHIVKTPDAFDIVLPEINAVYTHMLGHSCHSIVAGYEHASEMLQTLEGYLSAGYQLVLTSHSEPESQEDVKIKIAYLKNLKAVAKSSANAQQFEEEMQKQYPNYSGGNYLSMTAGFFFA